MSDIIENAQFLSLKPEFQPIVRIILEKLQEKGWQPYVAQGLRTIAEQQADVAAGNSETMHSYHLTGYAADIVDKRYGWDIPRYHQFWIDYGHIVVEVSETLDSPEHLRWGGVWDLGDERWPILERANAEKNDSLITWFADVAHVELHLE